MRTRAKKTEIEKRDEVLDALAKYRGDAIGLAKKAALVIYEHQGQVTSSDVLGYMRRNFGKRIEGLDPRFMGAVFRYGWKRKGYRAQGSHGRPVSVWVRR